MGLVKGIHHVSFKCSGEDFEKTVAFYKDILGIPVAKEWDGGLMLDTGDGRIEIFGNGDGEKTTGAIRHFALDVEDVDACVKAVSEAGYKVFIGPQDIEIPAEPPVKARMAFCFGPLGEQIEFFCEK